MAALPAALVDAAHAAPDSDELGREIAAWFDAGDPPRAELCRLDLADRADERESWLANLRGLPFPAVTDAQARYARRVALFAQHGARWREDLPPGITAYDWAFQRGLWTAATASDTWLRDQAHDLFSAHPIAELAITAKVDLAAALAQPALRHVRRLSIESIYTGVTEAVADATTLTALEHLAARVRIDAVLANPLVRALPSFHASGSHFGAIVEKLADGTTRTWRSAEGLVLETRYGHLPWLHASRWTRSPRFPGTVAFGRRWLVERGEPADDPPPVYAGTYRERSFTTSSLAGPEIQLLEAAGYRWGRNAGVRSYSYAMDGAPGWGGWIYFVDAIELSDAPWIERLEALSRR